MKKNVIAVLVIFFVTLVFFIIFMIIRSNSSTFTERFPYAQYMQNPKGFSGNRYMIKSQIELQLAYDDQVGRVLLIKLDPDNENIPIFIPQKLADFNPMAKQVYIFDIVIGESGELILTNAKKL